MNENLLDFCELNNEEVEDVLFFMLIIILFDKGKVELISRIDWKCFNSRWMFC